MIFYYGPYHDHIRQKDGEVCSSCPPLFVKSTIRQTQLIGQNIHGQLCPKLEICVGSCCVQIRKNEADKRFEAFFWPEKASWNRTLVFCFQIFVFEFGRPLFHVLRHMFRNTCCTYTHTHTPVPTHPPTQARTHFNGVCLWISLQFLWGPCDGTAIAIVSG